MSTVSELLDAAQKDVDSGWLPACQLAVARDNEIVAFETFGDATNETRFAIFSATKPIVASAVWHLIADGSVDVSKRVVDYIPEFGTHGKEVVTIEQVMLHTSGFPGEILLAPGADRAIRLAAFADWKLAWEPGTRFEYHGVSAHWVLAELIERTSGLDFRDFVEQRVTTPLGLPRVLGIPPDRGPECAPLVERGDAEPDARRVNRSLNEPEGRAAGVPGGGAFMTAAELARFYQGVMHNPEKLWDAAVLEDAKTNVRCVFPDPMMRVPANRTLGLVLAGDDGLHELRYAIFGAACSPGSFGHAGAYGQVGWGDPASGISFAYLTNGLDPDGMRAGIRSNGLATIASALEP
jgi:CubicO group peptidase (beta-lactamase class C family)